MNDKYELYIERVKIVISVIVIFIIAIGCLFLRR